LMLPDGFGGIAQLLTLFPSYLPPDSCVYQFQEEPMGEVHKTGQHDKRKNFLNLILITNYYENLG
jgi:hypothetical protein